jgi:RES domain-containing protein
MRLYRLCKARYSALDGVGASLYGGRWNNPGIAVVYTASSLSLAILETRVHLTRMPVDYVKLEIEIPDAGFHPHEVAAASLIPSWSTDEAYTRGVGDALLRADTMTPIKVPSIVVATEWNVLFSPDYAAVHATIVSSDPIDIDPRLWSV